MRRCDAELAICASLYSRFRAAGMQGRRRNSFSSALQSELRTYACARPIRVRPEETRDEPPFLKLPRPPAAPASAFCSPPGRGRACARPAQASARGRRPLHARPRARGAGRGRRRPPSRWWSGPNGDELAAEARRIAPRARNLRAARATGHRPRRSGRPRGARARAADDVVVAYADTPLIRRADAARAARRARRRAPGWPRSASRPPTRQATDG